MVQGGASGRRTPLGSDSQKKPGQDTQRGNRARFCDEERRILSGSPSGVKDDFGRQSDSCRSTSHIYSLELDVDGRSRTPEIPARAREESTRMTTFVTFVHFAPTTIAQPLRITACASLSPRGHPLHCWILLPEGGFLLKDRLQMARNRHFRVKQHFCHFCQEKTEFCTFGRFLPLSGIQA